MNFPRGYLAAALATAMAVAPSLAQDARVAPDAYAGPAVASVPEKKPTLLRQAERYSETNPVVVIAISKGQKETLLTGEQIGEKLAETFKDVHDIPTKYFIAPGGDYTAIAYFVKGHAYGPYGLKESLVGMALAADGFDERVRRKAAPASGIASSFAAKPELHQ